MLSTLLHAIASAYASPCRTPEHGEYLSSSIRDPRKRLDVSMLSRRQLLAYGSRLERFQPHPRGQAHRHEADRQSLSCGSLRGVQCHEMCDTAVQMGFSPNAYPDVILDNGPLFCKSKL